jgi:hypothetical protein
MRCFERQETESPKERKAFKVYRDLGPGRSLDWACAVYRGEQQGMNKRAMGRFTEWSRKHDWVARAQAFDDFHELIRRETIEHHQRSVGTNTARRDLKLQEEVLWDQKSGCLNVSTRCCPGR